MAEYKIKRTELIKHIASHGGWHPNSLQAYRIQTGMCQQMILFDFFLLPVQASLPQRIVYTPYNCFFTNIPLCSAQRVATHTETEFLVLQQTGFLDYLTPVATTDLQSRTVLTIAWCSLFLPISRHEPKKSICLLKTLFLLLLSGTCSYWGRGLNMMLGALLTFWKRCSQGSVMFWAHVCVHILRCQLFSGIS